MTRRELEKTLTIISRAWGDAQNDGHCFFPWIDREEQAAGQSGFHEKSFQWPGQYEEIIAHLAAHEGDDLYWCPVLFTTDQRRAEFAHEEYALWADLDEADPSAIDPDYRPTIAWRTSPGRYQALWLLADNNNDGLFGAAHTGGENQRLTRYIGADPSGWDITQLLRIPDWNNHKPSYNGNAQGRLLWHNGPLYDSEDFSDLPPIVNHLSSLIDEEELRQDLLDTKRKPLMRMLKKKLPQGRFDLLVGFDDSLDRSTTLRGFTLQLAELGLDVPEIITVLRSTEWNKFVGRPDELHRLNIEASSAVDRAEDKLNTQLGSYPAQVRWATHPMAFKKTSWLIPGILTEGGVGFIGGEPKMKKSWVGTDLALSMAMVYEGYNAKFLNTFPITKGGPVLYVTLEDPLNITTKRAQQIWESKNTWKLTLEDGEIFSEWEENLPFNPAVDVVANTYVSLSSDEGIDWLTECVARGYSENGDPYALILIDTLMTAAGEIDENRSFEVMTKLLSPIKKIRDAGCAILFIHHFRKSQGDSTRQGQRLLGAQAFHAWSEDSIFISSDSDGNMVLDLESKSAQSEHHTIVPFSANRWAPRLVTQSDSLGAATPQYLDMGKRPTRPKRPTMGQSTAADSAPAREGTAGRRPTFNTKVISALRNLGPGPHDIYSISLRADMTASNASRALRTHLDRGDPVYLTAGGTWSLTPRP